MMYRKELAIRERLAPTELSEAAYSTRAILVADENIVDYPSISSLNSVASQERVESDFVAFLYHVIGKVLQDQGHFKEALIYYQKALVIQNQLAPESLNEAA